MLIYTGLKLCKGFFGTPGISPDTSICFTMAFPPLGNSDQFAVLVSNDFRSNSKCDALFHRIAYDDYSCAGWDDHHYHLRDVSWEDSLHSVLLLLLLNFVTGFMLKMMYISLIVNIRSNLIHLHGFQLLVLLP